MLPSVLTYTHNPQTTAGKIEKNTSLISDNSGTVTIVSTTNRPVATTMTCQSPVVFYKCGQSGSSGAVACGLKYRCSFTRYHAFENDHTYVIKNLAMLVSIDRGGSSGGSWGKVGFTIYFDKIYINKIEYTDDDNNIVEKLIIDPDNSKVRIGGKSNVVKIKTNAFNLDSNPKTFELQNKWLDTEHKYVPLTLFVGYDSDSIYFEINAKAAKVDSMTWCNVRLFYTRDVDYTMKSPLEMEQELSDTNS